MAKVGWISISHASPWHAMANSPGISPLKHGVKSPMGSSPAHPMGLSAMSGTFGDIFLFNGMELGYDWGIAGNMTKKKRIFLFYRNIMGIVYAWDVTMVCCKKWNVLFQEVNFGGVSSIISRCLRYLRHLFGGCYPKFDGSSWFIISIPIEMVILG